MTRPCTSGFLRPRNRGQVKFACVDGPDFDGHKIDFDETIARAATYKEFEQRRRAEHKCRLEGMNNG